MASKNGRYSVDPNTLRSSTDFSYRPPTLEEVYELIESSGASNVTLAAYLGVSYATFYKWLQPMEYYFPDGTVREEWGICSNITHANWLALVHVVKRMENRRMRYHDRRTIGLTRRPSVRKEERVIQRAERLLEEYRDAACFL